MYTPLQPPTAINTENISIMPKSSLLFQSTSHPDTQSQATSDLFSVPRDYFYLFLNLI